jgi:uncharacterized phage-associated protein
MADPTVSVHDVAAFIVAKLGSTTPMLLQKLCYYAQAWSLVWDGKELFAEPIEAWVEGPIVRALWNKHRGVRHLKTWEGNPNALTDSQREIIERVLVLYDGLSPEDLSHLTHEEQPWLEARAGLGPKQPGHREITSFALAQFYTTQQQQFNDVFREFDLNIKLHRGQTIMYGRTRDDIELGLDRLSSRLRKNAGGIRKLSCFHSTN